MHKYCAPGEDPPDFYVQIADREGRDGNSRGYREQGGATTTRTTGTSK